jgi:hypothetical protein
MAEASGEYFTQVGRCRRCSGTRFEVWPCPHCGDSIQVYCAVCGEAWSADTWVRGSEPHGHEAVGEVGDEQADLGAEAEGGVAEVRGFDRKAYQRGYMRGYMRERRAAEARLLWDRANPLARVLEDGDG